MKKYLELWNLSKTYPGPRGPAVIVREFNLTVDEGEFIVILGPNGAGKSTLLKLLLGLLKPSAGIVRVLGRPPRRGNSEIGYAPQHRVLEADLALRARDVVGFGLDGNRWGTGFPSRKRTALIDEALVEVDALAFAVLLVSSYGAAQATPAGQLRNTSMTKSPGAAEADEASSRKLTCLPKDVRADEVACASEQRAQ